MLKKKDERIREAQGQKSKAIANQNKLLIFLTLINKPLTFSELLKETGFSKPVLTKHLKGLQKDGSLDKDTVKPDETSDPDEIGKVVYRVKIDQIAPLIVKAIEHALQMPKPDWDDESKTELQRLYGGIARVLIKQWSKRHGRKGGKLREK